MSKMICTIFIWNTNSKIKNIKQKSLEVIFVKHFFLIEVENNPYFDYNKLHTIISVTPEDLEFLLNNSLEFKLYGTYKDQKKQFITKKDQIL